MAKPSSDPLSYRGRTVGGARDSSRMVLHCICAGVSGVGASVLLWAATVEALIVRRLGTNAWGLPALEGCVGILLMIGAGMFTWKIIRFRA